MQQGYSSLSVCVSVCVCVCVCSRSICSSVDPCCPSMVRNRHDTSKVFDLSILLKMLCSKVMASFTSSIGAAIYKVLLVVIHSYPNDDSETATFDLTVVMAMLTIRG